MFAFPHILRFVWLRPFHVQQQYLLACAPMLTDIQPHELPQSWTERLSVAIQANVISTRARKARSWSMRNVQLDIDHLGVGTMNSMETRVCLPGGDGVLSASLFCSFEICDPFFLFVQLHSLAASIFTNNDGQSVGSIPEWRVA